MKIKNEQIKIKKKKTGNLKLTTYFPPPPPIQNYTNKTPIYIKRNNF